MAQCVVVGNGSECLHNPDLRRSLKDFGTNLIVGLKDWQSCGVTDSFHDEGRIVAFILETVIEVGGHFVTKIVELLLGVSSADDLVSKCFGRVFEHSGKTRDDRIVG